LVREPWAFLASLPGHGDVVTLKLGPWSLHVLCAPEALHQVLVDDRTFDKGGPLFDKAREVLGDGVATCPHRMHRRQRRLVQPAFNKDRMPAYAGAMTSQIAAITRDWRDDEVVDVVATMHALATRVATRTMFATEVDAAAVAHTQRCVEIAMAGIYRRLLNPFPVLDRLPLPANRRYDQARAHIRHTVAAIITDYRRSGTDHDDLLSMLLAARDPDTADQACALSDEEVSDQVTTFFISGIATTAATLAWAMHLLSTHPDIDRRVHEEAAEALHGRTAAYSDLPRLELTRRVIRETIRLYPPGWVFTRVATTDTQVADTRIHAGDVLLYSPYILHHRADLFPAPDAFDPDRWSPYRADRIPRGAYIPFGAGPRKCIGEQFTLMQTTLALASITARWRLRHQHTAASVTPALRATMVPQRLHMRLSARPRASRTT
jgi:pentalenene oxygenase